MFTLGVNCFRSHANKIRCYGHSVPSADSEDERILAVGFSLSLYIS